MREYAFETNGRDGESGSNGSHGVMQLCGKRMCCIDHEAYVVVDAETTHGISIHGSADSDAVMECHVLLARLGAVVVGRTGFF